MNRPTILICLILLFIAIYSIKSYARKLSRGCCDGGGGVWASVDLKKSQAALRSKKEPDVALFCKEMAAAGYRAEKI